MEQPPRIVVATRIHLDKATTPPSNLRALVENLVSVCAECNRVDGDEAIGVIAVDATERIAGYNLVEHVQTACNEVISDNRISLTVLPVQPWGKFVPALNALVGWASIATAMSSPTVTDASARHGAPMILFCSAETVVSLHAITVLRSHMDDGTLVCGAVLPGHDFQESSTSQPVVTALNGRTTPWNTLALWNLSKLSLTGFQAVSDGLQNPAMAGVEEVVAIAVLQTILGPPRALAKLIRVSECGDDTIQWNVSFADPARQAWHEQKLQSKLERAAYQLELMGLEGKVHHC